MRESSWVATAGVSGSMHHSAFPVSALAALPWNRLLIRNFAKVNKTVSKDTILRNEQIQFKELRVVFHDPVTDKQDWKIMSNSEALQLAKSLKLDLVLVSKDSTPPVCRIEDYGEMVSSLRTHERVKKANDKARSLKEMFVGGGIESHDLETKLNKVKQFLEEGHPVKISVLGPNAVLTKNPLAMEEVTLKVLEALENMVGSVQQSKISSNKKEFILNPKSKPKDKRP